ncbi:hypothetical protein [Streptomyces sp. ISL-86]|uniref:hypothetical protein n=1 Tax=Streptomyces sp. ISL-86 TaxID=2819187 RepID=UPI001BE7F079|nr:hypothetical protein [Streptomyces sp. ISL-86]MBT2455097.1 hypothetical protein [Streptomyces sp. ISL-86]
MPKQQISRDFTKAHAKAVKDVKAHLPMRQRAGMPRNAIAFGQGGCQNPFHAQAAELPLYLWHRPVRSPWVLVMLA